jgi:hypothetical protein
MDKFRFHAICLIDNAHMTDPGFAPEAVKHQYITRLKIFGFDILAHFLELGGASGQLDVEIFEDETDEAGTIKSLLRIGTAIPVGSAKQGFGEGQDLSPVYGPQSICPILRFSFGHQAMTL